ncbi:MAG TPA: hypothetical protein VF763_02555 [Candidatus Limnocylindrales bacterium]
MHLRYIAIAVAVIVIVVLALAWWYSQRRRSDRLRERFGPEYERAVSQTDDRGAAERELAARQERVSQLRIRDLSPDDRARFAERWRAVQTRFVDDPGVALADADRLVGEVMAARGYPMADFEQRAADVSVDHPAVVEQYRAAHAIAQRQAAGQASTEDLRQGMVHYRSLFDELLGQPVEQGERGQGMPSTGAAR